ncbi:hypothetical protein [uncultured Desulfobacter sp.]|uniref:hypothetical protein n=1 Tax=uncultured Desulfobacter sp. TaxID=240139 RepID=UPI002AA7AEF3|nr:hypothetical protein [uncultured Desulfobacter sp.]
MDRLEIETLLFQTGYLTIKATQRMGGMRQFQLSYPNQEVRQSLTDDILSFLTDTTVDQENNKFALYEALAGNDFHALKQTLQAFFSSIPHDWYRKNQTANYEGYYASILNLKKNYLFRNSLSSTVSKIRSYSGPRYRKCADRRRSQAIWKYLP